jgi:D-threo-aldose 1-dehydrogenase
MQLQFAQEGKFDCFLLVGRYTLLNQTALGEFLPYCLAHDISVVAGAPYNSGLLAVGTSAPATFNYEPTPRSVLDKARRIERVCVEFEVPLKAAALQFILAHPAIASVIPGARSSAELEDNIRMVEFPIPAPFWRTLKERALIDQSAPAPG